MKTTIESVREYICDFLSDYDFERGKLNIGYLPENTINFSIEESPMENGGIISTDILGNTVRQFNFVLAAMFDYSEEIETMIGNSGFFEEFQEWIEKNNEKGVFPLFDKGTPTDIEVLTSGYLFYVPETMDRARYQIQCQLTYEKEAY